MVIMQSIFDWLSNINVHYIFITITIQPCDTARFNISITCMIFRHLIYIIIITDVACIFTLHYVRKKKMIETEQKTKNNRTKNV